MRGIAKSVNQCLFLWLLSSFEATRSDSGGAAELWTMGVTSLVTEWMVNQSVDFLGYSRKECLALRPLSRKEASLPSRLGGGVMSYYRIVVILKSKSSKRLRRKVISLVRGKSWEGKNGITSRRCRENPICDLLALRLIWGLSTYVKPLRAKEADSGQGNWFANSGYAPKSGNADI